MLLLLKLSAEKVMFSSLIYFWASWVFTLKNMVLSVFGVTFGEVMIDSLQEQVSNVDSMITSTAGAAISSVSIANTTSVGALASQLHPQVLGVADQMAATPIIAQSTLDTLAANILIGLSMLALAKALQYSAQSLQLAMEQRMESEIRFHRNHNPYSAAQRPYPVVSHAKRG